jgi:hypothetical protein
MRVSVHAALSRAMFTWRMRLCSIRIEQREQERLSGGLLSARHGSRVRECRRSRGRVVRRQWGLLVLPSRVLLAHSLRSLLLQHEPDRRGKLLRAAAVRRCGTPLRTHQVSGIVDGVCRTVSRVRVRVRVRRGPARLTVQMCARV